MREEATVVGVQGRLVRVRMKPSAECGTCCACSVLVGSAREMEIETELPVAVGSRVVVEISQAKPWLSALLLFVLPLAGLIFGMIAGAQWGSGDAAPVALGFGLLAAFYVLAAAIDRAVIRKRIKPPAIVEVLGPDT